MGKASLLSNITNKLKNSIRLIKMMMICSQVKREMDASPPSAKYVRSCVSCMLNTQLIATITGFSCGSQQGTKGRLKSQECL